MKKLQQLIKGGAGMIGMVCLLALTLSSCLKNHDNDYVEVPAAYMSAINASPGSPDQDIYLDNNLVNNYPINYGNGLDYFRAYTGKRTIYFYTSGTKQVTKSDTITLGADKYYSVFLANTPANADLVILRDTLNKPAAGMAAIRFVDLSPDAPAVDFAINGGAVLTANKLYKGFSSFTPISGNKAYTFEIRQAGTSTVLVNIPNVTIQSGSIYTVWLQGLNAATDNTKLKAGVQTNAYYY